MAKYHFNHATGEAGPCKAELSCPFGLPLDGHFDSLREAAVAAEEHLAKVAGGSFGANGMVENFEEWTARREAQEKLAARKEERSSELAPVVAPVSQYRSLMPTHLAYLGDYAREVGLDLQESWYFAGALYDAKETPTANEAKELMLQGIKKHVNEASDKTDEIDKTLNQSKYFANPKLRHRSSGTTLETYSTHDGSDLITRVDERGKATFEVYDHEDGESNYSKNVEGWQSSIGTWMSDFKTYQDHLYLRVLWENEQKRRTDRYEAISKKVMGS